MMKMIRARQEKENKKKDDEKQLSSSSSATKARTLAACRTALSSLPATLSPC